MSSCSVHTPLATRACLNADVKSHPDLPLPARASPAHLLPPSHPPSSALLLILACPFCAFFLAARTIATLSLMGYPGHLHSRLRMVALQRAPSSSHSSSLNQSQASGTFLYFLDDDNCLKPHALATLLSAAQASGAHVLTSPNEKWPRKPSLALILPPLDPTTNPNKR